MDCIIWKIVINDDNRLLFVQQESKVYFGLDLFKLVILLIINYSYRILRSLGIQTWLSNQR